MGSAVSGTHIVMALRYVFIYGFNIEITTAQLRYSSRIRQKMLSPSWGHNIDYRSIPQISPVSCLYKLENLEKPYVLIRYLWFICKVSSFFQTFTNQCIVHSNNITLTAVREKRKTKPCGNKHKYACGHSYTCTCAYCA